VAPNARIDIGLKSTGAVLQVSAGEALGLRFPAGTDKHGAKKAFLAGHPVEFAA
jgi:hypothetical protein